MEHRGGHHCNKHARGAAIVDVSQRLLSSHMFTAKMNETATHVLFSARLWLRQAHDTLEQASELIGCL